MTSIIRRSVVVTLLVGMVACAGSVPSDLGLHAGKLAACPASPNCVTSGSADEQHSVEALRIDGDAQVAWASLVMLLKSTPDVRIVTNEPRYLHAEFTSHLMRYVDDVEFAMSPDRKEIAVRSASRLGYGDMGANRDRIEWIRGELASLD